MTSLTESDSSEINSVFGENNMSDNHKESDNETFSNKKRNHPEREDNRLAKAFTKFSKLLILWLYLCENGNDESYYRMYDKKIQLVSGETKYKNIVRGKEILNSEISLFVSKIKISQKCKIYEEVQRAFTNLNDSVKKKTVSTFLKALLNIKNSNKNDEFKEIKINPQYLDILNKIEVTDDDRKEFEFIKIRYMDNKKGRKKKFEVRKMNNSLH